MRGLYVFFIVILISIQSSFAMHFTACANQHVHSYSSSPFACSLLHVARSAQLNGASKKENEEKLKACMKVAHVPVSLIKLGEAHSADIKKTFNVILWGTPHKGLSEMILDYVGDTYVDYKDLFFWQQDSYGCMMTFYPFVGLVFDHDGTNIHAQLNGSRSDNDHQLVRWNLFSDATGRHQIRDYDLGPKHSTKENVEGVVSARYMWWQAQALNIFDSSGNFAPAATLKVALQYNLLHMIKAALS